MAANYTKMIIVRTPLRLEFLGGSTDIDTFYRKSPGHILNTTINKYIYIILHRRFDRGIKVMHETIEEVFNLKYISHSYIRAALKHFKIARDINIVVLSDVSARGLGLGSSSSLMVGLSQAFTSWQGQKLSPRAIAETACHLEIDILKSPIGKQDQYVAAFGGFNAYFTHTPYVQVFH